MTSSPFSDGTPAFVCPICGTELVRIAVTTTGELISCEDCAQRRGLTAQIMTLAEWEAPDAVRAALERYGVVDYRAMKTPQSETQEPRAHVWEVQTGGRRFFLKRYHAWLDTQAIRYEHSLLAHLAERRIPVAVPLKARDGETFASADGMRWGLYPALPGRQVTYQEWMWRVPRAAEMLALVHVAAQEFQPDGAPHPEWGPWSLARVDNMLRQWPQLPDPLSEVVASARDRLAERYFAAAYSELPRTIVHGDYGLTNLLWQGENISGVLDFERAHPDTVLFDFGWGIGTRHPPLVRAVVATYTRGRPLSPLEREVMPEALVLGALMGIHAQFTVYGNVEEAMRRAQELFFLLRDAEALRRAVVMR